MLLYSGNNQRSKLDVKSSSIPVKHLELFYCLIGRLLFTSEITRPDVLDCVTYVLTMMELSTNYCKNRNLNTDLLLMKKIQIIVLIPTEDWYTHFETLFLKHKKYILVILQQIIQSQRFENVSTVFKGVLKNMIKWLNIRLHTALTKHITDQQEHTTNNTRKA